MDDLFEDLRDGHNLVSLLEVLSGDHLVWLFLFISYQNGMRKKFKVTQKDQEKKNCVVLSLFIDVLCPSSLAVALVVFR